MKSVVRGTLLEFDYINWKGVNGHRKVQVWRIFFGKTEFHKESQWLLEGMDLDKEEVRTFAMKDMSNVKEFNIS